MDDAKCADGIRILISDMISGRLQHERARRLLLSARLIPLEKLNERDEPTGIRPIAVIDAFYRLAGLYALQLCDVSEAFQHSLTQFGVKRTCGSERAFGLIRTSVELSGLNGVALTTDIENAFNSRRRAAIARAVYNDPRFGYMYRLFDWSYNAPTDLIVFNQSERVAIFSSAEGVRQGDPLAAVAFALSMEAIYDASVRAGNAAAANATDVDATCRGISILDDFTLVGHHRRAQTSVRTRTHFVAR